MTKWNGAIIDVISTYIMYYITIYGVIRIRRRGGGYSTLRKGYVDGFGDRFFKNYVSFGNTKERG